jgi:hypothetical protein
MLRYDDKGRKSKLKLNGHVENQYAYALSAKILDEFLFNPCHELDI